MPPPPPMLKNATFRNPMNSAGNDAVQSRYRLRVVAQLVICDARSTILLRFGLHSLLLALPYLCWGRYRLHHP